MQLRCSSLYRAASVLLRETTAPPAKLIAWLGTGSTGTSHTADLEGLFDQEQEGMEDNVSAFDFAAKLPHLGAATESYTP